MTNKIHIEIDSSCVLVETQTHTRNITLNASHRAETTPAHRKLTPPTCRVSPGFWYVTAQFQTTTGMSHTSQMFRTLTFNH